jgi:hypothetical protein
MIRITGFVHLSSAASPSSAGRVVEAVRAAADEIDLLAAQAAPTAPVTVGGGEVEMLFAFPDSESADSFRAHPYVARVIRPLLAEVSTGVETVRYAQGPVTLRDPDLDNCVHRTLLFRVDPATDPADVAEFEQALAAMTDYIEEIRNASLSRVDEVQNSRGPIWTHVWEQEYRSLGDFSGPYMRHAYHWSYVDSWFDPQSPNALVDPTLLQAACEIQTAILRHGCTNSEARPAASLQLSQESPG